MHSVLLLHRAAVLADPKDDSNASDALNRNIAVKEDDGEWLEEPIRVLVVDDHHAGRGEQGREPHAPEMLKSVPSFSEDAEWSKTQSYADDAAAKVERVSISAAGGGTEDRGRRVGDDELAAPQAESAQAIAEQLQSEASRGRCVTKGRPDYAGSVLRLVGGILVDPVIEPTTDGALGLRAKTTGSTATGVCRSRMSHRDLVFPLR